MSDPAIDFVSARINPKDIERSFHRAIVALLASDIPLDKVRRAIARHYDQLAFPDPKKHREWLNGLKAMIADLGEGETNEHKAEMLGMTIPALLKLKQRYLKK